MIEAVRDYLATVTGEPLPEDVRLRRLAELLDCLIYLRHRYASAEPDEEEVDAPAADWNQLADAACRAFPDLADEPLRWYNWSDPRQTTDEKPSLGNAINDIAHIAGEMSEVAWRWDTTSHEDARFHFWMMYSHWGFHAHALRGHLFFLML